MTTNYLQNHHHVTEREVAHHWPDGQWDNGRWEDCGWTTAVEFARLAFDADIPATHEEVEHLRDDAGQPPGGGSNSDDLLLGLRRRYGYRNIRTEQGFWPLWRAMPPGTVACAQGSMGAFRRDHRLRRHDRNFAGPHNVLFIRLDNTNRLWWCDPLAPEDGYEGEWVTQDEAHRFVSALPGTHLVDTILTDFVPPPLDAGNPMTNLFPMTVHRVVDLPQGTVLFETPNGDVFTTLKKPVTLGLLGATAAFYHVADGDYGVYVQRKSSLKPYTADKNVGV